MADLQLCTALIEQLTHLLRQQCVATTACMLCDGACRMQHVGLTYIYIGLLNDQSIHSLQLGSPAQQEALQIW